MAEIRNVNIDKEFIVKFGVCRTNISDDMLPIALEVLPKAIEEVLQETMAEDGEITVTPVKHGHWYNRGGRFRCSVCDNKALLKDIGGTGGWSHEYEQQKSPYCPHCGALMDGGESNG